MLITDKGSNLLKCAPSSVENKRSDKDLNVPSFINILEWFTVENSIVVTAISCVICEQNAVRLHINIIKIFITSEFFF